MRNILVITGGAGFVGSNLIRLLLNKTKYKIISIDNYISGNKKNHIKNKRVKYIKSNTKNISQVLKKPEKIKTIFSFWRICKNISEFYKNEPMFRLKYNWNKCSI